MVEVLVIADDLTGAADTSVGFLPYLEHVVLFLGQIPKTPKKNSQPTAWAMHTASRGLSETEAFHKVLQAGLRVRCIGPGLVYKKVDSCMRGNVGAEVQALLKALDAPCSFIAPAHPEMGRTTIGGVHLLRGVPVAETEMAWDPVSPVRSSSLQEIVAATSDLGVHHVELDSLRGDQNSLEARIREAIRTGVRHVSFDASEMTHLERIAALGLKMRALMVGSAALAEALAKVRFARKAASQRKPSSLRGRRRQLLVVGSKSPRSKEQVSLLLTRLNLNRVSVPVHGPLGKSTLEEITSRALRSQEMALLVTPMPQGEQGLPEPCPTEVLHNMASVVTILARQWRPEVLFLTGGDTAQAVLEQLRVNEMVLMGELLPGVVVGRARGGPVKDLIVVTKAGSFGEQDVLIKVLEATGV